MKVDVLVRGGLVVDGSGAPGFRGDVAIRNGEIVSLGAAPATTAAEVVDASGKVVAPGFIDIHSHGDLVLAWPSSERLNLLEGRIAQGITTEIVGNCGLGATPLLGRAAELLPGINGWMAPAHFEWTWSGVDTYLAHLSRIGVPVNVGTIVAHGPLRVGVRSLVPGETTGEERALMEHALDQALEEGAFGLSAGLIYPPGMYASTDELQALARRLKRHEATFTCHVRGSSETLLDAVAELVAIGRTAGVSVHHSHAEAVGRKHFGKLARMLEMSDEARAEGIDLSSDMFPYTVAATMMLAIFPPWALDGGVSELLARLKDSSTRARIRSDVETLSPEWPPWREGAWPHNLVHAVGWDRIRISSVGSDRNRGLEGMTLAELGRSRGVDPFEAIADVMLEEDGNVGQFVEDISGEEGLRALVKRKEIAFVTDANDYGRGKPHPAAYGSFPRVLARYVRDESILSLPEAVRRMTSLPADILGVRRRGRLEEGAFADVVVFDPAVVEDRASLDEPRHKARGMDRVLVNGKTVYRDGVFTGVLSGRTLRLNAEA